MVARLVVFGLSALFVFQTQCAFAQHSALLDWADKKQNEIKAIDRASAPEDVRFNFPAYLEIPSKEVRKPPPEEKSRIDETISNYISLFGKNSLSSLLWTGVESGNPLTRDEKYRWNSLRDQGLYERDRRITLARVLKEAGITNMRMGLSNHEIDVEKDSTWREHDAMMRDFDQAGLRLSLDLHHFGIEDRFRVKDRRGKTIHEKSYYLNPAWPRYFGRFAGEAFRRYRKSIEAVTLINEPETVVGFNSEMWHGAFPRWGNPLHNFYYIERALQVGKAAVEARLAIEKQRQRGDKLIFMHTEAAVYKPYWEDFNRFVRFTTSDLILGHEWFMNADLEWLAKVPINQIVGRWHALKPEERTSFDWLIENYIVYAQPQKAHEKNRKRLLALMGELRALHHELQRKYAKTMRSETVFAVDYYSHNEDKGRDGQRLDPEPQNYPEQIRAGNRAGLYSVIVDYYNHYMMPVMIGESGTPYYYYGAMWNQQMLLECAKAARDGIPFLGYMIYPVIDTWGWETALSVPKEGTLLNPSGVVDQNLHPRPFVQRLLDSLRDRYQANK